MVEILDMGVHELGHYIAASSFNYNPYITYDLSQVPLISWGGWSGGGGVAFTHYSGAITPQTDLLISMFGAVFAIIFWGCLWIMVFGFEKDHAHLSLNIAIILIIVYEATYGIYETLGIKGQSNLLMVIYLVEVAIIVSCYGKLIINTNSRLSAHDQLKIQNGG